jgi:hypothetical protein
MTLNLITLLDADIVILPEDSDCVCTFVAPILGYFK